MAKVLSVVIAIFLITPSMAQTDGKKAISKNQEESGGQRPMPKPAPTIIEPKSPQTAGEQSDENTEINRRIGDYTGELAGYTAWLAAATVLLAFIAVLQLWQAFWGQRRVERAYGFGGPGPVRREREEGVLIRLEFGNYGRTPAFLKEVEWGISPQNALPTNPVYNNRLANRLVALPGTRENTEASYICKFDWKEPHALYARFTYEDIFGKTHKSSLLVSIRVTRPQAGRSTAVSHPPIDGYPEYVKWD